MDFQSYFRHETNTTNEFEEEDDVFYRELRRQVMQLTSEEDDGDEADKNGFSSTVPAPKPGIYSSPPVSNVEQKLRSYNYNYSYNWYGNKEEFGVAPPWMLNLWRSSGNGTGVFIPQNVESRRKNRSRRKKNGRTYKMVERTN